LSIAISLEFAGQLPATRISGLKRCSVGLTLTAIAGAPCVENVFPFRPTSLAVSAIDPAAALTSGSCLTRSRTEAGKPPVRAAPLFEVEIAERAVITALEFVVIYIRRLTPILIPLLLTLSAGKFALVVMYFMHLRYDSRVLTFLFVIPLTLATMLAVAVMTLTGDFLGFGR